MKTAEFCHDGKKKLKLSQVKTGFERKDLSKAKITRLLEENVDTLAELQSMLYAQARYGVLIIFQAMDTAGKDGAIKHVMSGLNPQGTQVYSFKQPSAEELRHDYMWRATSKVPERGHFGIFNRSYYEEVLVVRVHDLVKLQNIPGELVNGDIWKQRYGQIRDFEDYLSGNGIITLKFFLHISKEEQKKRLLERVDNKSKNWKFSEGDIEERKYWNKYMKCYEEMLNATSSSQSPWYIIPADKKWGARLLISEILIQKLKTLELAYPIQTEERLKVLKACKEKLLKES